MAHWAQRARWIVAVAGVTFAFVVFVGIRQRERPAPAAPITPRDPRADAEITGATSQQWSGSTENFTVKAERQLIYPDGSVKIEGVTVYVDDREGNRKFVATAREGEAGPNQDFVNLRGDVKLVASDGLSVETAEASYNAGDAIVRAPGSVTFSRDRLSGRGVGLTYDRTRDVLWLQEQATISLAPDDKGAGQLEVTAATAGLARKDKYLRFERDVRILRDNRVIRTDNAVGYLSADESRLTALDLRGHSRIEISGAASGALEAMHARDINLIYSADGEHLDRALLAGGAAIQIAGDRRRPGRRIAGELLDVGLTAEGTTVTSLIGRQGVQIDFPQEPTAPARTIRATTLDSTASDGGGLTAARLTESVEYQEVVGTPPGTPPALRIVRARVLDVTFTSGMAGITDARFSGAVCVEDGDVRGSAVTARYEVDRGVIELLGDPSATPTVADPRITIDARRILLTVEGPKVAAKEAVRSVLGTNTAEARSAPPPCGRSPTRQRSLDRVATSPGGPDQVKLPGFLQADQPVNVTANALDYDGSTSRAIYSGSARLWQGAATVQGDSITIDSTSGNLSARGSVRSTWPVEETDTRTKQTKKVATAAAARELEYDDQARRATYTTDASVSGPQGDLQARKIELYLGDGENELERVEGYDAVTLRDGGRTATGDRLSYFSADERYEMTGAPVRIVEDCREMTGRTLTFYKSTDKILVDGQQGSRTLTTRGSCPEPPRTKRPSSGR